MSDQPLSSSEMSQLVGAMVFDQRVASAALPKVMPTVFSGQFEDPHRVLWQLASEHLAVHKVLPTYPTLLTGMMAAIDREARYQPFIPLFQEKLLEFHGFGAQMPVDHDQVLNNLLPRLLKDRVIRPQIQMLDATKAENLAKIAKLIESAQPKTGKKTANLFELESIAEEQPNPGRATGFEMFDRFTTRGEANPGGLRRGNSIGVLGGYMAGKTMFGIELKCAAAKYGLPAVMFHYEQNVEQALRARIWACLTGISSSVFEGKGVQGLTRDEREKLEAVRHLDKLLHVYDMQKDGRGTGGIGETKQLLREYQDEHGETPAVVVYDWMGLISEGWDQKSKFGQGQEGQRLALDETMRIMQYEIALEFNTQVVALHQLSTEAGSKPVSYIPTKYDAMASKKFAALLDYCIAIGTPDHNGRRRALNVKARGTVDEAVIKADGYRCKFEIERGEFTIANEGGKQYFLKTSEE